MRLEFVVDGRPVPQGSMTAVYNKKLGVSRVRHAQGAALAMWRALIRETAREAGAEVSAFPISIRIVFGMKRPKGHYTLRRGGYVVKQSALDTRPAVAPDIDKLLRAVLDALTDVCYHDDAQVVSVQVAKVYADSTTIVVYDTQAEDASRLDIDKETDTSTRQLSMSDLL